MSIEAWDRLLLGAAVLCLMAAPWSWADDGVTPSWIVFPLFLLAGLWRLLRRGSGRLWLGLTGLVFLLVHLPWVAAAVWGDSNPLDEEAPFNPEQWLVTLLVLPLLLTVAGLLAWRRSRTPTTDAAPRMQLPT